MNRPSDGDRRKNWIAVVAASVLLAWRLASTGTGAWKDWLAVVALHAIFTVFFVRRTRLWTAVTMAVMLGLAILYGHGHLPRAMASLGVER